VGVTAAVGGAAVTVLAVLATLETAGFPDPDREGDARVDEGSMVGSGR
jgi:hypothetical protein